MKKKKEKEIKNVVTPRNKSDIIIDAAIYGGATYISASGTVKCLDAVLVGMAKRQELKEKEVVLKSATSKKIDDSSPLILDDEYINSIRSSFVKIFGDELDPDVIRQTAADDARNGDYTIQKVLDTLDYYGVELRNVINLEVSPKTVRRLGTWCLKGDTIYNNMEVAAATCGVIGAATATSMFFGKFISAILPQAGSIVGKITNIIK